MNLRELRLNLLILVLPLLAILAQSAVWLSGTRVDTDLWLMTASLPALLVLLSETARAIGERRLGVDLLAVLSIAGAMALDQPLTAAVIAAMTASGRVLDGFAAGRAEREMTALLNKAPRHANRLVGDTLERIALDAVRPGDRLLVKTGEVVPVDGPLAGTHATLDTSSLTGESAPTTLHTGQLLQSGALNAGEPFEMIAATDAANSTFGGIVRLVASARATRAPAMRLADRYAFWFMPCALALAGAAWLVSGDPLRALAVLVVATPCPLLLAVPVAIVSGMSSCARRGVLVKGGAVLEALSRAQTLFFDKTGTLTGGQADLVSLHADGDFSREEVLRLAASLDQMSCHVIAGAILQAAHAQGVAPLEMPDEVRETVGAGLAGRLGSRLAHLGSYDYVRAYSAPSPWAERLHARLAQEGASSVFLALDGRFVGALELADRLRLETPRALRLLRRAGVHRIVMLTGDRREVAESIGSGIGVDCVYAELAPADKLARLAEAGGDQVTLMVGDGVNDAPALAAADVGVAMGARGAAAAAESAGVVLLVDRLDRLAEALMIARQTRRIALQSVWAGMGLSFVAMLAAALGVLPPLAGALLQEAIDVAVILNALRALRIEPLLSSRQKLSESVTARLRAEHRALQPLLERLGGLAMRLPQLEPAALCAELTQLEDELARELLPHEHSEEQELYPEMAPLLGGDDPLAALSRSHQEIFRSARRLSQQISALPGEPDTQAVMELQRTLYGLDAILRLHFAQEDELFHSLC
jgi:heavy metal translocating P-type ATPase